MNMEVTQQIEQNIKQAQKLVDLRNSLERLMGNKDFKKVILEDFFEQEAIRLVHLKSDNNMQTNERQFSIANQMNAIGGLKQYFQTVRAKATIAANSIESDELALEELANEDTE